MLRKMLAVLLVVTMIVSLAACAGSSNKKEDIVINSSNLNDTTTVTGGTMTTVTDNAIVGTETSEKTEVDETKEDVIITEADGTNTTTSAENTTTITTTTAKGEQNGSATTGKHTHKYSVSNTVEATCTADGSKTYICSCGSTYEENIGKTFHNYSAWKDNGNGEMFRTCTNCGKKEYDEYTNTPTTSTKSVVCTGYEIVKVERPNACYIDGQDVLTYFFGKNKYFQEGDIVTFELSFSKGSLADCIVEKTRSAENIKISGNTITVKIVNDSIGNPHPLCISIANEQYDQFNANRYVFWIEENNILWYDGKIVENNGAMTAVIENYASKKYNIQRCINMNAEEGYSYSRFTTGEDPSITKQHGVCNNGDDAFWKTDVENWAAYVKTIIDFYGDIGIKRIKICLEGDWVGFVASKNK